MLGLAASLCVTSCDLDKTPTTALPTDEAITSAADLDNAIRGVAYNSTVRRMAYASEFTLYADVLTDNFEVISSQGQITPLAYYSVTKYDEFSETPYYYFYKAIAMANKALGYAEKMEGVNNQVGQLYAWRGLLHFDLARMFAHIPSTVADTKAAQSGIVLSTEVLEPEHLALRNTLEETYNQIIADLTKAIELLPEKSQTGYMNKYVAQALRARAYLYMGEYQNAKNDADAVINSGKYKLYDLASFANVWKQEGTSESIFEVLTTSTYSAQRNACGYFCDAAGYPEVGFNTEGKLYKYLASNENDVRSTLIKDQTGPTLDDGTENSAPGYYPNKYPGRDNSLYINNPKVVRLSEMYLIAAEACLNIASEGGAAAAKYINEIEKNRIEGYQPVASITLDDLLWEYTLEMFCENQIAFAYWRNKQSITNQNGEQIAYNHERTILPTPQAEIDLKADLAQNAGY